MKKILITGKNSYVGRNLLKWLGKYPDRYSIDSLSLRDNSWKKIDFSKYDTVFHVAALVHKKERSEMKDLYFSVNRDLPVEVAIKAKNSGVRQFVFMSSISVYGISGKMDEDVIITKETECSPRTYYGRSKLEAEMELRNLANEKFKIAIVRAPMIYGPDCPGNFKRLEKLIMKLPLFPLIENQRSMIFINNLSEFLKLLIDNEDSGVFFPQNREYVNTSELVEVLADVNSKKIIISKGLSSLLKPFGNNINTVNKLFGSLVIDSSLSNYEDYNYCIYNLRQSIENCKTQN